MSAQPQWEHIDVTRRPAEVPGTGAQAGVCPGVPGTGGGACTGLACQINKCTGMPKTTVKGTV